MIELRKAHRDDVEVLTEIQIRTFVADNKHKPHGCSMEGPPGYNSIKWNMHWVEHTLYYKILFNGQIVGGMILFELEKQHFEVGRIWIDPEFQNQGIGQASMRDMFDMHPGTPTWAIRNQHFYENLGFVKIRETDVDPDLGWSGIEYERIIERGECE